MKLFSELNEPSNKSTCTQTKDIDSITLPARKEKIYPQLFAKNIEKLRELKKSYNPKRNIKRIYNKKLHYNCL